MTPNRHRREAKPRSLPRAAVAGSLAALMTIAAVVIGVLAAEPAGPDLIGAPTVRSPLLLADVERDLVSRSGSRLGAAAAEARGARKVLRQQAALARAQARKATLKAVRQAETRLWTVEPLNLWSAPWDRATKLGEIVSGRQVLVTGRRKLGRVELALDGTSRWVTAGYLSEEKPQEPEEPEESGPSIGTACTNGTAVSSGVSSNIAEVHRAVCAAFPSITTYGTLRGGGGDHPLGRAVDIMVSGSTGQAVADFVRASFAELGVSYVIHAQQIWSMQRGAEGWRFMGDRGSTTANHYDHVHVSTY